MLPKYHSYLLHLWQASLAENPTWRASLEDPHTHQVTGFDTLKALCDHLATLDREFNHWNNRVPTKNSTINDSLSDDSGGGIYASSGSVLIYDSTIVF